MAPGTRPSWGHSGIAISTCRRLVREGRVLAPGTPSSGSVADGTCGIQCHHLQRCHQCLCGGTAKGTRLSGFWRRCADAQHWHQALGLLAVCKGLVCCQMSSPAMLELLLARRPSNGTGHSAFWRACRWLICCWMSSTLLPSVLVGRPSTGTRHSVFWRRCKRHMWYPMSSPTALPSTPV